MALNRSDIVPEPFGNLVDRNACARQEAGESMPHDMRRHPRNFLCLHIEVERPTKIPAIDAFSARGNLRMNQIWLVKTISLQKRRKSFRQWNRSLFSVFKLDPFVFAQMQESRVQIKPRCFCLHNLVKPQAGMKTTVKHELQIIPRTFGNQFVSQRRRAKVLSGRQGRCLHSHLRRRIIPAGSLYLHAPTEKAAKGHEISVSRPWAVSLEPFGVVTMDYFRGNLGRSDLTCPFRKAFQDVSFAAFSGQSPFSASTAIPNVTFHGVTENRSGLQDAFSADFFCSAQCFNRIARLQADEMAFLVHLTSEPVDTASSIDAAHRILSTFHTQKCNTFTVTLSSPIREELAGYEDK